MKDISIRRIKLSIVLATCGALMGCAHQPPQELELARQAYARASTGPAVRVKPDEVHKAYTALQLAERSYSDDPDSAVTRDLAYIAERKAELAEALAAGQSAENEREAAKQSYQQKQAAIAQQTQQRLGETKAELGQTKEKLAQERQESQRTQQQLATEQQARAEAEAQAKQAEEDAKRASDALVALQAKEEARGMVITLSGSVLFASNEATLLPDAQTRLNQVAEALLQSKERRIVVEGHTDSRGSASLNQSLSQRRAEAVRAYIVSRGYPADKIDAQGIGPARPVADNKSAEGRANNRRVEIIVSPKTRVSTGP